MPWSSKWSPSGFLRKTLYAFLFFLHAPFSAHLILLVYSHLNNIWGKAQIMKLLIMQFSPVSCYRVLLRHKYVLKHPVLKWMPTGHLTEYTVYRLKQCNLHSVYCVETILGLVFLYLHLYVSLQSVKRFNWHM